MGELAAELVILDCAMAPVLQHGIFSFRPGVTLAFDDRLD